MSDSTPGGRQFLVIFHLHHSLCERNWQVPNISPHTSVSSWPCSLTAWCAVVSQFLPLGSEPAALGIQCQWKEDTGAGWKRGRQEDGRSSPEMHPRMSCKDRTFFPHRSAVQSTVRVQSIILKARSERQVLPTRQERKPDTTVGGWGHMNHGPTAWHFPLPTPAPTDMENDCHSSSKIHCCLLLLHPSKL